MRSQYRIYVEFITEISIDMFLARRYTHVVCPIVRAFNVYSMYRSYSISYVHCSVANIAVLETNYN